MSLAPFRGVAAAFPFSLLILSGCYNYLVKAPGGAGAPAADGGEVVWSYVWGLAQEPLPIRNCNNQPLAEVRIRSNLGFALLTVVTLGFAAPTKVEWSCAKAAPTPGTLDPRPPPPPPADSTRRP